MFTGTTAVVSEPHRPGINVYGHAAFFKPSAQFICFSLVTILYFMSSANVNQYIFIYCLLSLTHLSLWYSVNLDSSHNLFPLLQSPIFKMATQLFNTNFELLSNCACANDLTFNIKCSLIFTVSFLPCSLLSI